MKHVVVPKDSIKDLLESLMTDYKIVAPVREGQTLVYKAVNQVDEVILNDEAAYKSPKEFLFPQTEQMMVFSKDGDIRITEDDTKTILFGVRSCDLEALKIMTAVFTQGKFIDTYFEKKLKNTVLIGFGCQSEKKGCFCGDRGLNKGYSEACDAFLTDNGDQYIVQIITEKGELLFGGFAQIDSQKAVSCESGGQALLEINSDESTLFNNVDWGRISEKCMGCGTCTYICPTCHCFVFKDVVEKGEAIRYKCWDSCMYPKFTMHASGHNPRASKKERYRQRILHKYLYVKQNFGYTACTGCGRCIRSCPVGMNIKSVVTEIMEGLK